MPLAGSVKAALPVTAPVVALGVPTVGVPAWGVPGSTGTVTVSVLVANPSCALTLKVSLPSALAASAAC